MRWATRASSSVLRVRSSRSICRIEVTSSIDQTIISRPPASNRRVLTRHSTERPSARLSQISSRTGSRAAREQGVALRRGRPHVDLVAGCADHGVARPSNSAHQAALVSLQTLLGACSVTTIGLGELLKIAEKRCSRSRITPAHGLEIAGQRVQFDCNPSARPAAVDAERGVAGLADDAIRRCSQLPCPQRRRQEAGRDRDAEAIATASTVLRMRGFSRPAGTRVTKRHSRASEWATPAL